MILRMFRRDRQCALYLNFGSDLLLRQVAALPPRVHILHDPQLPQWRHPRRLRQLDVELLARPLVPLPGRSEDWEALRDEVGVGLMCVEMYRRVY